MEKLVEVLWGIFGAGRMGKKDLSVPGRRRIEHVLPLVINALNHERRRKILAFLLTAVGKTFSFKEIKEKFPRINNRSLSNHLQILQKAWLITRTADLSDPTTQRDSHHSFYQLSDFGFKVSNWLADFLVMVEKDYLSKEQSSSTSEVTRIV